MSIFAENGKLTSEALSQLDLHSDKIACECPHHLIEILRKVRDFAQYTNSCIDKYPQDAKTHQWLFQSAENIDTLLSATIAQLARFEGFLSNENEIVDRPAKLKHEPPKTS